MKLFRKLIYIFVLFALISIGRYFVVKPDLDSVKAGYDLAESRVFGFGARGVGGTISDDEVNFFRILESPKSYLVFRDVFDKGTPEAKAYAIVGLKQTFLGRRDRRIEEYGQSSHTYSVISGCRISNGQTPQNLLAALEGKPLEEYFDDQKRRLSMMLEWKANEERNRLALLNKWKKDYREFSNASF